MAKALANVARFFVFVYCELFFRIISAKHVRPASLDYNNMRGWYSIAESKTFSLFVGRRLVVSTSSHRIWVRSTFSDHYRHWIFV